MKFILSLIAIVSTLIAGETLHPSPPLAPRATFTPAPTLDARDTLATDVALHQTLIALPTMTPTAQPDLTPGPSGYPILPAPLWEPPQPLVLPLRMEATGGATLFPVVLDGRVTLNIRPMAGQSCWRVRVWDASGQFYQVQRPAASCATRFYLPFVSQGGS